MKNPIVPFDETLSDEWGKDLEVVEVPLTAKVVGSFWVVILFIGVLISSRVLFLGVARGEFYGRQANLNLASRRELQAPRGLIYDRNGEILVENKESFFLYLDVNEFVKQKELEDETIEALRGIVKMEPSVFWDLLKNADIEKSSGKILLAADLELGQVITLKGLNLPTIFFESGFRREYVNGPVFSSILGYTGLVNREDLKNDPKLSYNAIIGRGGIESSYDEVLRGKNGVEIEYKNALGEAVGEKEVVEPAMGRELHLTIDAEFQRYFVRRFKEGLTALGRSTGVGLAVNPQNGEVLALANLPLFDNNVLSSSGHDEEKKEILQSQKRPLFNRAISGTYQPGSTIKPLLGVAALKEKVITPDKNIFSAGYLDIPNPYYSDQPSRFLDWRRHGWVNLTSAIAQSSNVYFYVVGGGFGDIKGLGINRMYEWWRRFNLGSLTGIDLPYEADGFLPDAEEKRARTGEPWRLGDTYNVSIGQGDLLVTPIQLLSYIGAMASGGIMYRPYLASGFSSPKVIQDLSSLLPEIKEIQKGMIMAVQSPLGTAHIMNNLPFTVAAKTGTAQVLNKTQENAFFVGYAPASAEASVGKPAEDPEIAILILIENSREGSLNTVPIAKDVLDWYYWNRIKGLVKKSE